MTEELLKQGIAAARAGRKQQALRQLMQVADIDERNELAWLWLSQVVDTPEDKATCLQKVLDINPHNDNARAGLAWLAQSSAPVTDAEPCPRCGYAVPLAQNECPRCCLPQIVLCPRCRTHVEIQSSTCPQCLVTLGDFRTGAAYHLALAQAYIGHGQSDLAPGALAYARSEAARDPEVLVRVAELYVDIGQPEPALEVLAEAASITGAGSALQARIGVVYQCLDRLDQARIAFERSVPHGGDPVALRELARIELKEGRAAQARELLQKVTKARPLDVEGYLLLGDAERALGNEREARDLYQHAAQLTPRETVVGREIFSRLIEIEGHSDAVARTAWRRQQRDVQGTGHSLGPDRPGCITVYAVWLALSAVLGLCGTAVFWAMLDALQDPALLAQAGLDVADLETLPRLMPFVVGLSLAYVGVEGALAAGLWFMKNWARVILIGLNSIGFIAQLVTVVAAFVTAGTGLVPGSFDLLSVLFSLVSLGLEAYIIFWFATNRKRFS